jgi:hypothetical protein
MGCVHSPDHHKDTIPSCLGMHVAWGQATPHHLPPLTTIPKFGFGKKKKTASKLNLVARNQNMITSPVMMDPEKSLG